MTSDDAVSTLAIGRSEPAHVAPAAFAARSIAVSMTVRFAFAGVSDCHEKKTRRSRSSPGRSMARSVWDPAGLCDHLVLPQDGEPSEFVRFHQTAEPRAGLDVQSPYCAVPARWRGRPSAVRPLARDEASSVDRHGGEDGPCRATDPHPPQNHRDLGLRRGLVVEAPGIEPGSENAALLASTCVSGLLISPRGATASSLSPRLSTCLSSPSAPVTRAWASQIDDALAEALTGFGSDGSIRFSGGESDCVVVRN